MEQVAHKNRFASVKTVTKRRCFDLPIIGQDDSNWNLPNGVAAFKYHLPSKYMRHAISGTQTAHRSVAVEALLLELAHPKPSVSDLRQLIPNSLSC